MEWKIIHIDETDSTNRWLRDDSASDKYGLTRTENGEVSNSSCQSAGKVVVADYQTAGRGCGTNRWEAERGKNLLFSMLIHPKDVPASRQFRLSMAVSLAICEALEELIGDVSIKWPNDIYWRDGKICGILIENTLTGAVIKDCIIGVGLNVNQRVFHSDAPNPVSLLQISGQDTDRDALLHHILERFGQLLTQDVRQRYLSKLYRRKGFYPYADEKGAFMAEFVDVKDDGHLVLRDDGGTWRTYAFKEVRFI